MLDIRQIRQSEERVQAAADQKRIPLSVLELLDLDDKRRHLLQQLEQLRYERNQASQLIGGLMRQGNTEQAEREMARVKQLGDRLSALESDSREAEAEYAKRMLLVPNLISPDTPAGLSDADNVELRRVGDVPCFDFEPRDHVQLGQLHRMIDIPRGVKTAGSRHYYLTGAGVALHRAVQQLALDLLTDGGFQLLEVPLMVRGDTMVNTGYFPMGESQTFRIDGEDRWLAGTSEVPLVSYYSGEIVDVTEPIKLAAVSLCFRNEVGSAGRDVHGLYRVHQFAKVEQVVICRDSLEQSELLLQEITAHAEQVLRLLELPYRVVAVCAGDMAQKTYKQLDIETWMPSRQAYGETHSSSNLLDFQARRSQIRYRDADGKLRFCYTLNNTAVASPRILIPLLEHHQLADGTIRIPQALRLYMNGLEYLQPPQP